jgi:hypothetical protein
MNVLVARTLPINREVPTASRGRTGRAIFVDAISFHIHEALRMSSSDGNFVAMARENCHHAFYAYG